MSVSKFQSRNKLLSNLKKILKCLHKLYKKTEKNYSFSFRFFGTSTTSIENIGQHTSQR